MLCLENIELNLCHSILQFIWMLVISNITFSIFSFSLSMNNIITCFFGIRSCCNIIIIIRWFSKWKCMFIFLTWLSTLFLNIMNDSSEKRILSNKMERLCETNSKNAAASLFESKSSWCSLSHAQNRLHFLVSWAK